MVRISNKVDSTDCIPEAPLVSLTPTPKIWDTYLDDRVRLPHRDTLAMECATKCNRDRDHDDNVVECAHINPIIELLVVVLQ